jgi:hypothetical protein
MTLRTEVSFHLACLWANDNYKKYLFGCLASGIEYRSSLAPGKAQNTALQTDIAASSLRPLSFLSLQLIWF